MAKKIALITGGSRGIGAAISKRLAKDGFHILLNFKSNNKKAEDVKKQIEIDNGSCSLLPFDVADFKSCEKALSPYNISDNPIAVLVNNAGIRKDNLLAWMEPDEWNSVLRTNLDSSYNVTKNIITGMITARKGGVIVNITSTSGEAGMAGQVNYAAAKAGQIGVTKTLALELGKRNIRVNAVSPGFIETDLTKDLPIDEIKKNIPLKRVGSVEDVSSLVSFLCSDEASYITGQVVSVNGGIYI